MEDKDFLGYFGKLGPPSSLDEIKSASNKIVNTLVAISSVTGRKASMDSVSKTAEDAEQALKKKYAQGDLGEKVSADLNYTLKRLVRGLHSENHSVKQGFFLASVLVLTKFKSQIDFEKYLKFVFNETKTSKSMKGSEVNNMTLGRMMCMSACIEAKVFALGSQINQRSLKVILGCLVEIYKDSDILQESVSAIFTKLLSILKEQKSFGINAIEIILEQLIWKKDEGDVDFKARILGDSNMLALFLRIRESYKNYYNGMSKEYENLMSFKLLNDKKNLKLICGLIKKQTYLYPRLHSCIPLLINELINEEKLQDKVKLFQQFIKIVLDEFLFNEETYSTMKSVTKFKFLNIGFKLWQLIADSLSSWDPKLKAREQILDNLIQPNFLKVLIKNISSSKAHLHKEAQSVKSSFLKVIQESKLSPDYSLKLLLSLFGPNTNSRFSIKKYLDILKVLTTTLQPSQVQKYYEHLKNMFSNPSVEEYFGNDESPAKDDDEENKNQSDEDDQQQDSSQKKDIIKTFALNQIGNFPTLFRNQLTQDTLINIIEFIVKLAYFGSDDSEDIQKLAAFKLFGLVQILYKIKLGENMKGMKNSNEIWISEVNAQIQKIGKKEGDKEILKQLKVHQECLQYIKENITEHRLKYQKKVISTSSNPSEASLKDKSIFKKLLSMELLFQNLSLLLLLPDTSDEILSDIDELKHCYSKLSIIDSSSGAKRQKKDNDERQEALSVLFDFLISLLTKPQSFLRDIANFTFKQFCTDISQTSLSNMIQIVSTPNVEANKMLFDEEGSEGEEEEVEEDENEGESDDEEEDEDTD